MATIKVLWSRKFPINSQQIDRTTIADGGIGGAQLNVKVSGEGVE